MMMMHLEWEWWYSCCTEVMWKKTQKYTQTTINSKFRDFGWIVLCSVHYSEQLMIRAGQISWTLPHRFETVKVGLWRVIFIKIWPALETDHQKPKERRQNKKLWLMQKFCGWKKKRFHFHNLVEGCICSCSCASIKEFATKQKRFIFESKICVNKIELLFRLPCVLSVDPVFSLSFRLAHVEYNSYAVRENCLSHKFFHDCDPIRYPNTCRKISPSIQWNNNNYFAQ